MSIELSGLSNSIAGVPLAARKGPAVDRAAEDVRAQERLESGQEKAEAAAGVGPADGEDHHATGRDADGRPPWEETPQAEQGPIPPDKPLTLDPLGRRGELLDLSG